MKNIRQIIEEVTANGGQGDLGIAPNNPLQVITGTQSPEEIEASKDASWGFRSLFKNLKKDKK